MNREKAEKLLAALLFDDLDASSKEELTAYLQTDDELREHLTDMRMAVKVTSDALQSEPERALDQKRLKKLARLAEKSNNRSVIFTMRYLAAAAAVLAVIALPAYFVFMPSLQTASKSLKPGIDISGGGFAMFDSDSTFWTRGDGVDVAGDRSFAYEIDSEDIGYKRSAEQSSGGDRQITQVFDFEDSYGDDIKGGAMMGGGGRGNMGGLSIGTQQGSNPTNLIGGDGGHGGNSGSIGNGVSIGGGIYTYNDNGDSGTVLGWNSAVNKYESSPVDSSTPADRMSNTRIPESVISNSILANRSEPSGGPGIADREGRSATIDSINNSTKSYYNGYLNGPFVEGKSSSGHEIDGIDVAASVIGIDSEPSVNLDSLGVIVNNGESATLATPPTPRMPASRPQPKPAPATTPPDVSEPAISRRISGTGTTAGLPETPVSGKPAETPEPGPGEWGGFAVNGLEHAPHVKPQAELVEIPQSLQDQLNGDIIAAGEKFNSELSLHEETEISNEKVEFRTKGVIDENGDIIVEDKAKAPLLGDLPIVGELFKSESTKDTAIQEDMRKEIEAAELNKEIRKKMDAARAEAVSNYMDRASAFTEEQRYEEALGQLEQLLAIDPQNRQALDQKQALENTAISLKQRELTEQTTHEELSVVLGAVEKSIPYSEEINYPHSWAEVAERRKEALKEESNLELPVEDISNLPAASRFKSVPVNPWVMTERDALSTFALDVDTASYTLSRRYISSGYLPPAGAVRMEEFINYFNYQYPQQSDRTFRVHAEAAASPFAGEGKNLTLLKIGVKARTLGRDQQKPAHLVFVIDTSASMGQPDRLPLIQQALNMLIDSLNPSDRVTLITCSDQARLHLDAVPVSQSERIRQVINAVQPSGTTNLLAGLQLGYATARRAYSAKQINQIVLCSDGVANVGQTEAEAVLNTVAEDRKQGITITCVGVGYGTYNDAFMESLADQGDGSYVFLDSLRQAQRVFVDQLAATLHTVAKDARIQVSFKPERVRRYRLIGYENRDIEDARFRDDTIDAGEVGSGQCSTALYELEMINSPSASQLDDLGTVFVRYRNVDTDQFEEISCDLENSIVRTRTVENSPYFYLAAAVAQYAEILRQSEHVQGGNLTDVLTVAEKVSRVLGLDRDVRELAELIRRSENLPRAQ